MKKISKALIALSLGIMSTLGVGFAIECVGLWGGVFFAALILLVAGLIIYLENP